MICFEICLLLLVVVQGAVINSGYSTDCNRSDKSDICASWAANGQCDFNPVFMLPNCPKSCDDCDGVKWRMYQRRNIPSDCDDKSNSCANWAKDGECAVNPNYMLASCKRSCDNCDGKKQAAVAPLPDVCFDIASECSHPSWKKTCQSNSGFMSVHCRATCGVCKPVETQEVVGGDERVLGLFGPTVDPFA